MPAPATLSQAGCTRCAAHRPQLPQLQPASRSWRPLERADEPQRSAAAPTGSSERPGAAAAAVPPPPGCAPVLLHLLRISEWFPLPAVEAGHGWQGVRGAPGPPQDPWDRARRSPANPNLLPRRCTLAGPEPPSRPLPAPPRSAVGPALAQRGALRFDRETRTRLQRYGLRATPRCCGRPASPPQVGPQVPAAAAGCGQPAVLRRLHIDCCRPVGGPVPPLPPLTRDALPPCLPLPAPQTTSWSGSPGWPGSTGCSERGSRTSPRTCQRRSRRAVLCLHPFWAAVPEHPGCGVTVVGPLPSPPQQAAGVGGQRRSGAGQAEQQVGPALRAGAAAPPSCCRPGRTAGRLATGRRRHRRQGTHNRLAGVRPALVRCRAAGGVWARCRLMPPHPLPELQPTCRLPAPLPQAAAWGPPVEGGPSSPDGAFRPRRNRWR